MKRPTVNPANIKQAARVVARLEDMQLVGAADTIRALVQDLGAGELFAQALAELAPLREIRAELQRQYHTPR